MLDAHSRSLPRLIEAAPDNKESVGNHVFGVFRVGPALNEPDQVRVDRFIGGSIRPSVSHQQENLVRARCGSGYEEGCEAARE